MSAMGRKQTFRWIAALVEKWTFCDANPAASGRVLLANLYAAKPLIRLAAAKPAFVPITRQFKLVFTENVDFRSVNQNAVKSPRVVSGTLN